jgi:hypothetical protein
MAYIGLEYCLTTTHVKRRWVGNGGADFGTLCDVVPMTELV